MLSPDHKQKSKDMVHVYDFDPLRGVKPINTFRLIKREEDVTYMSNYNLFITP